MNTDGVTKSRRRTKKHKNVLRVFSSCFFVTSCQSILFAQGAAPTTSRPNGAPADQPMQQVAAETGPVQQHPAGSLLKAALNPQPQQAGSQATLAGVSYFAVAEAKPRV